MRKVPLLSRFFAWNGARRPPRGRTASLILGQSSRRSECSGSAAVPTDLDTGNEGTDPSVSVFRPQRHLFQFFHCVLGALKIMFGHLRVKGFVQHSLITRFLAHPGFVRDARQVMNEFGSGHRTVLDSRFFVLPSQFPHLLLNALFQIVFRGMFYRLLDRTPPMLSNKSQIKRSGRAAVPVRSSTRVQYKSGNCRGRKFDMHELQVLELVLCRSVES